MITNDVEYQRECVKAYRLAAMARRRRTNPYDDYDIEDEVERPTESNWCLAQYIDTDIDPRPLVEMRVDPQPQERWQEWTLIQQGCYKKGPIWYELVRKPRKKHRRLSLQIPRAIWPSVRERALEFIKDII